MAEFDKKNINKLYKVVSEERVDYSDKKRLVVRIHVPIGIEPKELYLQTTDAAFQAYCDYLNQGERLSAIAVFAYLDGDPVDGHYTAGTVDYAPDGDWTKASSTADLIDMKPAFWSEPNFYKPRPKILEAGAMATVKESGANVYRKPGVWDDPLFSLPDGTEVRIIETWRVPSAGENQVFDSYRVRLVDGREGWIDGENLSQ